MVSQISQNIKYKRFIHLCTLIRSSLWSVAFTKKTRKFTWPQNYGHMVVQQLKRGGESIQMFLHYKYVILRNKGTSILIKQVIVYRFVCLFICSAMGGQTARPNGLKFGG